MTAVAQPAIRNGVDTDALFSTLDVVKQQPDIATFRFTASNTWVSGTHSQSTISGFYGAMQDMEHKSRTVLVADHPEVLTGADNGPTPERFDLLGISQGGGAVAVEYAARHPHRIRRLVLYGAYAQGRVARGDATATLPLHDLQSQLARVGWGQDDASFRQVFTSQFMPGGSKELWQEFNELQRRSTSPENAARLLQVTAHIDVSDAARRVRAPTLVLHARDDQRPPFEQGQLLSRLIPGARFVALEGNNHILLEDESAWPVFLTEMESFLTAE